jgi:hypothetical protein
MMREKLFADKKLLEKQLILIIKTTLTYIDMKVNH